MFHMLMSLKIRPEIYALLAAIANGTIGPLNRFAFSAGATYGQVAFFKCFLAFLGLLAFCLTRKRLRQQVMALSHHAFPFAILGFLGIFCLYFFETWAFAEASIPLVSFLVYAAGGVTILLSALVLGERMTTGKTVAFIFIISGVVFISLSEGRVSGSFLGGVLALLGGLGYALFIFFAKYFHVGSGLPQLVWLFGFGSLFLSIPLWQEAMIIPPSGAVLPILLLVIVPTIGGFWLTTKAIRDGTASGVQIVETSDPLFASLFAFILFSEVFVMFGWVGAICIMAGLLIALRAERSTREKTLLTVS